MLAGVWLWWGVAGLACGPLAYAEECKEASGDCVAVGRWNFSLAVGAGVRTNPLATGRDIPLVLIPQFSYYGRRVFIDNLDVGFTLAENLTNTLNLIATPGYDRLYFYRSDLQNFFVGFPIGPGTSTLVGSAPPVTAPATTLTSTPANTPAAAPVRRGAPHITYLAGPEWTVQYAGLSGQLDVLHDMTGQNSGSEIRAALGIPIAAPRGSLHASVGFTWKSAATVNYYYGVAGQYEAGAALDPFVKLGYTLPLSRQWRLNAVAEYERLGEAIARSPIIAEHGVETAFVGVIYAF